MRTLALCTAVAALTGSAASVFAGPDYIQVRFTDSYGNPINVPGNGPTGGGEFQIDLTPVGGSHSPARTGTVFQSGGLPQINRYETFCLEVYESIDFYPATGIEYSADISDHTYATNAAYAFGGHGSTTVSGHFEDGLDPKTAWLYKQFITKQLDNGAAGGTGSYFTGTAAQRATYATGLQEAIWFIEDEYLPGTLITSLSSEAQDYYAQAVAAAPTDIGNVRVLQIYHNSARTEHQDILIMIPLPGGTGMATAGLASLCGLGVLRRRR
jgi:hypothetical protein